MTAVPCIDLVEGRVYISLHAAVRHLERIDRVIDLDQLQLQMWQEWPQQPELTGSNPFSDAQVLRYLQEKGMNITSLFKRIRASLPGYLRTAAIKCLPEFTFIVRSGRRHTLYIFVDGALATIYVAEPVGEQQRSNEDAS